MNLQSTQSSEALFQGDGGLVLTHAGAGGVDAHELAKAHVKT